MLLKNHSVAIVDAERSTNLGIDNEAAFVIMNNLIGEVCDEIKSNKVQMDNMNNEKENIEKNGEDAFSTEVDKPLINVVSMEIGDLLFNNVTKFQVITDTLTVKGPDEL